MNDKTMILTGATGAVGREVLALAAERGWRVHGIYRHNHETAEALREQWTGPADALQLQACDLTDEKQVADFHATLQTPPDIDALIHLAAPKFEVKPAHKIDWAEYQAQLEGALKSMVLITRPLLKPMARRKSGRIICTLSAVVFNPPPRGFTAYTVAKHALAGYMQSLAAEYAGKGIAVNSVSPGPMDSALLSDLPHFLTDQMRAAIPGGQWIDPRTVAEALFWLAETAGPQLTGCNLPIAGGMVF